jgi:hypothetical protein
MIPTSDQDGRQAKNRKKGMHLKKNLLLLENYFAEVKNIKLKTITNHS